MEIEPSKNRGVDLAERLSRLKAVLIDDLISFIPIVLIVYDNPFVRHLGFIALVFFIMMQVWLLSTKGQTLGKRMLRIRIVQVGTDSNGGFKTNVLYRAIPGTILIAIPFVNLVNALFIFRKDRRCIHDFIAKTQVIDAD